jgi:hypothetical protein
LSKSWNNHQAAVSLTFDDGTPEQILYAVPELTTRQMKGTFFVVQSPEKTERRYDTQFRIAEWKAAIAAGHEIGGHSVTHKRPEQMRANPRDAFSEVLACKEFLQKTLAVPIPSYAYPFTYIDDNVKRAAQTAFSQARGFKDARGENKYISPTDLIDFHNVPSIQVNASNIDKAAAWFDTALARGAWITLMFHGIGPNDKVYDNIGTAKFVAMLDELQRRDIWVATFDEAACRLRETMKSVKDCRAESGLVRALNTCSRIVRNRFRTQ